MACHLVGDGDDASPQRRAGTGAARLSPLSIEVEGHGGVGVGICGDIWHATLSVASAWLAVGILFWKSGSAKKLLVPPPLPDQAFSV